MSDRNRLAKLAGRLPLPLIKAVSRLRWRHPRLRALLDRVADRLRHQDGTIAQGAGRGLRFNPGGSNAGFLLGTSEPGVQAAFVALVAPGMTCFDVGANVGFLSVIAARLVGPQGRVVAFDPLPENAARIRHNVALNDFRQVEVRELALGDADGRASFQVSENSTWGKLGGLPPPRDPAGEIQVEVRTLDGLLADEPGLPRPDVLKVDVEGAEVAVLQGAARLLAERRPLLMIELHGTGAQVEELLRGAGYAVRVLGSREPVVDSPWDAYLLAAPEERPEQVAAIDRLTAPGVATR